ncbi:thiamine biosynthesis protein ThiS [Candidatus Woesearchaeota archaeon]|mgnify:CR=1 FL=1|nr:MAG: thiamine biosynthesis protein ThiS [Candidatus Woesearchaeota archaeon]
MEVLIEKENKKKNINFRGNVRELLEKLDINPETVIIISNDQVLTEDEKLEGDEKIKILSVVSGG